MKKFRFLEVYRNSELYLRTILPLTTPEKVFVKYLNQANKKGYSHYKFLVVGS